MWLPGNWLSIDALRLVGRDYLADYVILRGYHRLATPADALCCDGNKNVTPRSFGIATVKRVKSAGEV